MKITDDLFQLVQSLSKSEKGYYKKFALRYSLEPEKNYLKLFTEIEKQAESGYYNEELIKNKFKSEKLYKNFPVIKVYLYDTILRALSSYYYYATKDNLLKDTFKHIEILYRKTLYHKCLKLLKKVKTEAIKYDNFNLLLETYRWRRNLIREGHIRGNISEDLQKISEEEMHCLSKVKNLGEFASICCIATNIVKTQHAKELRSAILKLLGNPLLKKYNQDYSYLEQINYYHLKSVLYTFLGNAELAYDYQRQLIAVIENNPHRIKENPLNYINGYYNLLLLIIALKKQNEFNIILKRLQNINIQPHESFTANFKVLIFVYSSISELKMFIRCNDFQTGINSINQITEGLIKYKGKITKKFELEIYSCISVLYFGAGLFNETLKWNNKIINEKSDYDTFDIIITSKLFNLAVHYELNNNALMHHLIKSDLRNLNSEKKSVKQSLIIINCFKKIIQLRNKGKILLHLQEAVCKLKHVKKENPNLKLLNQFDFISYFEHKIEQFR